MTARRGNPLPLKNFRHHSPINIGRTKIPARMLKRQLFVINPKLMQQSRVQIVHMYLAFHREMTNLIRCTPGKTGLESATGQKHSEAARIVIAPVRSL